MRGPGVVYVGNLPDGVRESEVSELFEKVRELQRDTGVAEGRVQRRRRG
jgi:hypothetical protein